MGELASRHSSAACACVAALLLLGWLAGPADAMGDQGPFPACDPVWADSNPACASPIASGADALTAATAVAALTQQERLALASERQLRQRDEASRYLQHEAALKQKEAADRAALLREKELLEDEKHRLQTETIERLRVKEEELNRQADKLAGERAQIGLVKQIAADNARTQMVAAAVGQATGALEDKLQGRRDAIARRAAVASKTARLDAHLAMVQKQRAADIELQKQQLETQKERFEQEKLAFEKEMAAGAADAAAADDTSEKAFEESIQRTRDEVKRRSEALLLEEQALERARLLEEKAKQKAAFEADVEQWKHQQELQLQQKYAKVLARPTESEYKAGYKSGFVEAQRNTNPHTPAGQAEQNAEQNALYKSFLAGWDRSHGEVRGYAASMQQQQQQQDPAAPVMMPDPMLPTVY